MGILVSPFEGHPPTIMCTCIPFKILTILILVLSVVALIQAGYTWITGFVRGVIWSYLLEGWVIALGLLTLLAAGVGITNGLTALLHRAHVAKALCIPHVILVGLTLVCVIAGYSHSLAVWSDYFATCGNQCVYDPVVVYVRLGISFFFFTAYDIVYLIFSIMFAKKALGGETESLLKAQDA